MITKEDLIAELEGLPDNALVYVYGPDGPQIAYTITCGKALLDGDGDPVRYDEEGDHVSPEWEQRWEKKKFTDDANCILIES